MAGTKKELLIKSDPNSNLYYFQFAGGGELPVELKGKYTSYRVAEIDRKKYYNNTFKKLKKQVNKDAN